MPSLTLTRSLRVGLALCFGIAAAGCPGGGGDTGAGTDGSDTSGSSGSTTGPTTSTTTSGMTAGSASQTTTTNDVTSETADPTETTMADTGPTTTAEDTTTGGVDPCAGLAREQCLMQEGCEALVCPAYENGNGMVEWCLADPSYVGCRPTGGDCPAERTVVCIGDDGPTFVCEDPCLPAFTYECDPPVDGPVEPCPGGGNSGGGNTG